MRRHDDLGNIEHGGDLGRVERPGAAQGDQRETARIEAPLDGLRPDGVGHVAVEDGHHALGRLQFAKADLFGEAADSAPGGVDVERHLAAQEIGQVEPAQHQVGVGHGRLCAPEAVGRRPGTGAGALRPHPVGAAAVDMGDAAAAGADGGDVQHRHEHRVAADPGVPRGCFADPAVDHGADIGAGAADVERDQPRVRLRRGRPPAAEDTGRRPGQQRQDRPFGDRCGGGDAAVGAHDVEVGAAFRLREPAAKFRT